MTDTLSRRAVLAGACGTCAATLAGCAAYDSGQSAAPPAPAVTVAPQQQSGAGPTPDAAAGPSGGGLVDAADVPVGGGTVFADQDVVITQPTEGEFKAFSATCTHQGCTVSGVTDGEIVCTCHNSTFAIDDGSPTGGPASKALGERKISMDGTSISLA